MKHFAWFALGFMLAIGSSGCPSHQTGTSGGSGTGTGSGGGSTGPTFTPMTTLAAETENNTSASNAFTGHYYNYAENRVIDYADTKSTTGNALPGHVSEISVHELLPAGSPAKVLVETQTWFCTDPKNLQNGALVAATGPTGEPNYPRCKSHIDIGYDSFSDAQAAAMIDDMVRRGVDGLVMNWDTHPETSAAIVTMLKYAARKSTRNGDLFRISVMEDEGVKSCAADPACDVSGKVIQDLAYMRDNFFTYPSYYTMPDGRPLITFFSVDAWVDRASNGTKAIDWTRVRNAFTGARSPVFVFENAGGFDHAASDGAYVWMDTGTYAACTSPATCFDTALGGLTWFYDQALKRTKFTIGSAYKGFHDGIVDAWNYKTDDHATRYIDQQCGLTWLKTFEFARQKYANDPSALGALQLITWDDYEEGTELETGIDNCVSSFDVALASGVLSWQLGFGKSVKGYAGNDSTIHHYEVYYTNDTASANPGLARIGGDISPNGDGKGSLKVGDYTFPQGDIKLFVKAVGQPFIHDHVQAASSTLHAQAKAAAKMEDSTTKTDSSQAIGDAIAAASAAHAVSKVAGHAAVQGAGARILSPRPESRSSSRAIEVSARAEAGSTLTLYLDGTLLDSAPVGAPKLTLEAGPGAHNLMAIAVKDGKLVGWDSVAFTNTSGDSARAYSQSIEGSWLLSSIACSGGAAPRTGAIDPSTQQFYFTADRTRINLAVAAAGRAFQLGGEYRASGGVLTVPSPAMRKAYTVNDGKLSLHEVATGDDDFCPRGEVETEVFYRY